KISTLHEEVTKVELQQQEVDQTLAYIHSQQDDLNSILDNYEKQLKDAMDESDLQQPLQLADLQREKAYGLAETLNGQLDDVNRNLNVMIDEVNKMSGSQHPEGSADDDTVGQIVKILNVHLSSLQWIDTTSMKLQGKLQDVSKLQEEAVRNQEPRLRGD
ncbi:hypothetical protein BJV82DRAFT_517653, partial [Fennellomyces sp. T-0311]